MINQMLRIVQIILLILVLLLGAWALVMYVGWPLWAIIPTLIGALLIFASTRWLYRRWQGWKLRKEFTNTSPTIKQNEQIKAVFEQQWQAGIQTLRDGRLGTQGRTLYGLPWILVLDVVPAKESDELNVLAIQKSAGPDSEAGLSWCFLKSAVMLRFPALTAQLQGTNTAVYWQLLIDKLNKNRRREPLNGVVFNIDSNWLEHASEVDRHQLGSHLRTQLNTINQIFNARISCWVVFSQSQHITGLNSFAESLGSEQRQQSFGFHEDRTDSSVTEVIHQGFNQVLNRTTDLCLWLGQAYPDSVDKLSLVENIRKYEALLLSVFVPAFAPSPYAVNPLLKGIYWTATTTQDNLVKSWFAEQLYEEALPYQRHAWEAVDRLGPWRRVLRQAAVVGWFGICSAILLLFIYAAKDVRSVIQQAASRNTHQLSFSGGVEPDLQALNTWHDMIIQLGKNTHGITRLLPFRSHLISLEQQLKEQFVLLYKREIRDDFMDGLILEQLPYITQQGLPIDIAAWAQYLVRRINLLQARIDQKSLRNLPQIGPEFTYLYVQANPQVGLQTGVLLGQLYPDYLNWQNQSSELQSELDSLKATLQQLSLGLRQIDWLLAWVDLQNDLVPITLADFWPIQKSISTGPKIAAGLTKAGTEAIQLFVKEIAAATNDTKFWGERSQKMNASFTQAAYDAWYRFLSDFNQGRNYLEDESQWKSVLSLSFTSNDPYIKLLNTINTIFSEVPAQQRPHWIRTAIELDLLLKTSGIQVGSEQSWLNQARVINNLGHLGWQVLRDEVSVEKGVDVVKEGVVALDELKAYEQLVQSAAEQMLTGEGNTLLLAEHTWAYGYDATITESPLHTAQQHFMALRDQISKGEAREGAVWRIANGPLSFALEYAARSTACGLQEQWNSQVLSVVENVHSQLLAQELLYGENGSVENFMKGPLHYFVERNKSQYLPRKALGLTVPLNGEFFAYLNTVQANQTGGTVQKFENEQNERQYKLQLEQLQQQEKELEKQETNLDKMQAIVSIEMTPPLLGVGAQQLPQRTSLSLQCAQKSTQLDNYNFPTKQVFDWDSTSCGNTSITFQFPNWSIQKTYTGSNGFLTFLHDFQTGTKKLVPEDFPGSEQLLHDAHIDSIVLKWQLQGQEAILEREQQKNKVQSELRKVQENIHLIRQKQAGPDLLQRPLIQARDIIPEQIAHQCWYRYAPIYTPALDEEAASRIRTLALVDFEIENEEIEIDLQQAPAPKVKKEIGSWVINVGVFANPNRATEQLDQLGFSYQTKAIQLNHKENHLVYISGFSSQREALHAANKIAKLMQLKPQVVNDQ